DENADLLRFVRTLIAFRKAHPVLRSAWHLSGQDYTGGGLPDLSWHGTQPWWADWSSESRTLALLLAGDHARGGTLRDDDIYVAANMHWEGQTFHLPAPRAGEAWHVVANTGASAPEDAFEPGSEPLLENQEAIYLASRSMVILVSR